MDNTIFLPQLSYNNNGNTKQNVITNNDAPLRRGIGRFKCDICNKRFTKPCLLQRHHVVHTAEKSFECPECQKRFSQKSSLQRHSAHYHKGEKQHKCPKCPQSFAQRSNLNMHLKQTHPSELTKEDSQQRFECNRCACVYPKLNLLNRHKSTVHGSAQTDQLETFDEGQLSDDPNALAQHVMEQLRQLQSGMQTAQEALENKVEKTAEPVTAVDRVCLEQPIVDEAVTSIVTLVDRLNAFGSKQLIKAQRVWRSNGYAYYVCEFCAKEFRKSYDFIRHRRTHTHELPYKCAYCEYACKTVAELQSHVKRHTLDEQRGVLRRLHECQVCHKSYSAMQQLDRHMRSHKDTHTVRYICPICHATFATKTGFAAHKHSSFDKELAELVQLLPAPIDLSPEASNVDAVAEARRNAYEARSFQCSVCGWKLLKHAQLRQHELRHLLTTKQQCATCKRFYATAASLRVHQKMHLTCQRRPHNCERCMRKQFATKTQLKRHLKLCTASRNIKCVYCAKCFKSKAHCRSHMKTHLRHLLKAPTAAAEVAAQLSAERPLQGLVAITETVQNASTTFAEFQLVAKAPKTNVQSAQAVAATKVNQLSVQTQTMANHSCQFCGKNFRKPIDLRRHLSTHTGERPHACQQCSKRFALPHTLTQHMLTHTAPRRRYTCQVCGKSYAAQKVLNVHLRLHTGQRPFKCNLCECSFRTSGHHLSHVRVAHKPPMSED